MVMFPVNHVADDATPGYPCTGSQPIVAARAMPRSGQRRHVWRMLRSRPSVTQEPAMILGFSWRCLSLAFITALAVCGPAAAADPATDPVEGELKDGRYHHPELG